LMSFGTSFTSTYATRRPRHRMKPWPLLRTTMGVEECTTLIAFSSPRDGCFGSRADLATVLIPPILVRTSLDSRHDGDRREDLRLVPAADVTKCNKIWEQKGLIRSPRWRGRAATPAL